MDCAKCEHGLAECDCPDFMEKMVSLSQGKHFLLCWGSSAFDNPQMHHALGMTPDDVADMRRTRGPTTAVNLARLVGVVADGTTD